MNIMSVSGYSEHRFRIVRVWCPDIPDDSPDIPDGAMQNFRPFDVIYVLCILPWSIVM